MTVSSAPPRAVLEQLKRAGRLASPAGVALRVLELSARDDVSPNEIARALQVDPSLLEQSRAGTCAAFDYPMYWSRCLATAVAADHLARSARVAPADDCFTLALLQDIGTLALASAFPRDYCAILERSAALPSNATLAAERAQFGVSRPWAQALRLADQAMYAAKRGGRNRVTAAMIA